MNQGIAFARTLRALDADDFRSSKLGLLAALALLAVWIWWMLAARVPQYQSTTNVQLETGHAIAYFFPSGASQIHTGQPAVVRLNGRVFPAKIQNISGNRADLIFTNPPPTSTASTPATADVEIGRLSPAAIALGILGHGPHPASQ